MEKSSLTQAIIPLHLALNAKTDIGFARHFLLDEFTTMKV